MKTADFFVERLKTWGVKRIFGYSGDGINGVIGALQRDRGIAIAIGRRKDDDGRFHDLISSGAKMPQASSARVWSY